MSLYLTRAELQELAQRERPSAICRLLDKRHIPYILDADDWPKVLRSAVLDQRAAPSQTSEPQLDLS